MIDLLDCPRCKTNDYVAYIYEDAAEGFSVVYCYCVKCEMEAPPVFGETGVNDEVIARAYNQWNEMIQVKRVRGDY